MKKAIDYIAVGVVFLCHDGAGTVLFGKRSNQARDEQGRWDVGGGGVHVGESLLEAVEREVKEEYAAEIVDIVPLGYREVRRTHDVTDEKTHWVSFDFAVHVQRLSVHNAEPEKCDEIGWFQPDAWPDPVHSQWSIFLQKYDSELREILG